MWVCFFTYDNDLWYWPMIMTSLSKVMHVHEQDFPFNCHFFFLTMTVLSCRLMKSLIWTKDFAGMWVSLPSMPVTLLPTEAIHYEFSFLLPIFSQTVWYPLPRSRVMAPFVSRPLNWFHYFLQVYQNPELEKRKRGDVSVDLIYYNDKSAFVKVSK